MKYLELLENELTLRKPRRDSPLVLDLFAGCGGLALGFEAAGFSTIGFEMDPDACASYGHNLHGTCNEVVLAPGQNLGSRADVVIGGPPCQPFSVGGLQEGHNDERNGFPTFLSAVARYAPKLVIIENVRGMLYRNKAYFDRVLDQLVEHGYTVEYRLLHAVQYGIPQRRERLFVVGHYGGWDWPKPCAHTYTAGDALGELAHSILPGSKFPTKSMDDYVARYERASKCIRPRDLHLDEPSRTVTCRNLNGATGDMLRVRLPDGRRRRLTVREGARLQGFPDWFVFQGSEGSQFNQVGNAVPPLLAKAVATAAMEYLAHAGSKRNKRRTGARPNQQLTLQYGN